MNDMFLENPSKYGFEETVERLSQNIQEKGWKLISTHDLQETLKNKGVDVLPVKVIELCNAKYASRILLEDKERFVASMLPCRIAVCEKSDGRTYISRMNAEMFGGMVGGLVQEVMTGSFMEAEEIVKPLLA